MGGEHPEWLPVGWKVSVKIRSCGRKDKYYVSPKGLKFNSKPEVLRYVKSSGIVRKPMDPSKIDIKKTVAEKLPPGWIKEIRTKKKGGKTRRDPYYIDPVTGRYFRSMQEVFRYLESNDLKKIESKPDDKGRISVKLGNHSQSLSPEAKGQRSIDKKADKSLSAPESVKSGPKLDAGLKQAATNNVNVQEDNHLEQAEEDDSLAIELSDKLQLVTKEKQRADRIPTKKLADSTVDNRADDNQRLKSGSEVAIPKKIDKREANVVEKRDRENDSEAKNLPNRLPQVNGKEEYKYRRRQSKRLADIKPKDNVIENLSLQPGSEGAAGRSINIAETNDLEQREKDNNSIGEGRQVEILAPQNKRKNWTSDLPRRTSKRLARGDVDPSLEVKTSNKDGSHVTLSGEASEAKMSKSISKPRSLDKPEIDNMGKVGSFNESNKQECRTEIPETIKKKKPITHGNLSSLEGHKDEEKEKHPDSCLKDLLMDPCFEFAIKTLTGAIPIDDLKKVGDSPVSSLASPNQASASSSMLPTNGIWADPCFEFAVKTLTSDIPVENGSQLQVTIQQPLSPLGATGCNGLMLPTIRLDNIYDDVKKPCVRQQGNPPNFVGTGFCRSAEGKTGKFT